jgi:RTA1 like protein
VGMFFHSCCRELVSNISHRHFFWPNADEHLISGGGIMASGSLSAMKIGEHTIVAGLVVQLLFFGFFVTTAGFVHRRISKFPAPKSTSANLGSSPMIGRSWKTVFWGLYAASFLILVRSVFRVIEYSMGNDGYLISHEAFAYIFDATLMFLTMVVLLIFHPSWVIKAGRRFSENSEEEIILSHR